MKKNALMFLALATSAAVLRAGLYFPVSEKTVTISSTSAAIHATFAFENKSGAVVKIADITTDCGCTAAIASSSSIQPGANGVITVDSKINPGSTTHFEHSIFVKTDDAAAEQLLKLIANVTPPVAISPKVIIWPKDDLARRVITVTLDPLAITAKITGVDGNTDNQFNIAIQQDGDHPGKYQLVLTPLGAPIHSRLTLHPVFSEVVASNIDTAIYISIQ